MNGPDIKSTLLSSIEFLETLRIPYALMGALTLGFYDQARATHDVDLLIDAGPDELQRVRVQAAQHGFSIDEVWLQHNPGLRDTHVRLIHSSIPIDVMLPRDSQDRSATARRRAFPLGNRTIWVVTAEDFILQKLKAGRPRDFDDTIPFFTQQRDQLDHPYLNQWALRLGVREELDYLWSQSEQSDGLHP